MRELEIIEVKGWCPNRPERTSFFYEFSKETGELELVSTTCAQEMGLAFGRMCPCWAEHDPKRDPEIIGWVIANRKDSRLLPAVRRYLDSETKRGTHNRIAAFEIAMKAYIAGEITEAEWVELAEKVGEIFCPFETARIVSIATETGTTLKPVAFVFANEHVREIASLGQRVEESFGKFTMGEIINDLHINLMVYVRRFHKNGEQIIARRMARLATILNRYNYGYVCHKIGWQLPDLTEEEKELRENYQLFKRIQPVFSDTSTENVSQYMAGNLIFEIQYLPNMEKGGRFAIRGKGTVDRETVKQYLREYSRRVDEVVKGL